MFKRNDPAAEIIEKEWVGISWKDIPKVKHEQHYHTYYENTKWNEIKNQIDICEANREDTSENGPSTKNIAESDRIGQDATTVLFIDRKNDNVIFINTLSFYLMCIKLFFAFY